MPRYLAGFSLAAMQETESLSKKIGRALTLIRETRGLTVTQLAKRIGCHRATVTEWERGGTKLSGLRIVNIENHIRGCGATFEEVIEEIGYGD
ncbi:helix-turn-helix domain-containing protein [Candidatus Magnetobacterium casense]|uniref:Helix-turn-helix transcriptional regulator n=1 Tax=Candidatus Magnetobacterium casense TaxID=1455061 RepID=A0ABS6S3U6_9BACT|nr:helix-turn-helix transcriptional regulator [Candidatus Magnetobacterium casensis]MBV6343526.1 helix-turn-helix transcriptional regulator [Candidatus Magnetobacterium casensis]